MSTRPVTTAQAAPSARTGIGLKSAHVAQVLRDGADVDFFEVHAENYMVAGGPFLRHLERVRERWALSIHGVGLSIGGPGPLDGAHLDRLKAVVDRFQPAWCSEHLAWSSHGGVYLNDLLPLAYDRSTLQRVCEHVDQLQQHLRRRVLLENPSSYVAFEASTMDESDFLTQVLRRTGCGLLLDINNAHISAVNQGRDAWDFLCALPADAVGEIHLAGHATEQDAAGAPLLIDTHGAPVAEVVWSLCRRWLAHRQAQAAAPSPAVAGRASPPSLAPPPILIEHDNDLPPLPVLVAQARQARALATRAVAAPLREAA